MLKPSSITVRVLFLALCGLLAFNVVVVGAQDPLVTQEPAPLEVVTQETPPTEATLPPEIVTPDATEAVTPVATEIVLPPVVETAAPVTTAEAEVTVTGSETTVVLPPEPVLQLLVRETFDNGDLSPWILGEGWSLVPDASGQQLQVNNSTVPAELLKGDFLNVAVQAEFSLQAGAAQLTIRQSDAGNYTATLDASGLVRLFRSGDLLLSFQGAPSIAGQADILRLSAIDGIVRVAVNNSEVIAIQDALPLPPGKVLVSADFTLSADGSPVPENMLLVNNFFLWVKADESSLYPAPTAMIVPTVQPTLMATEEVAVTQEVIVTQEIVVNPEIVITAEPESVPATETPLPTTFEGKDLAAFPAPSAEVIMQLGPLSNDDFADASLIPVAVPLNAYASSDDTTSATLETDETISNCHYNTSNTIWFSFTPTTAASYTVSTAGSSFDTVLAIYTGTTVDNLTLVGCNDDATTTTFTSLVTQALQVGVTYHIQLGGYNGRYGQYALSVVQLGLPVPTLGPILTGPANNTLTNNGSVPLPALTWNTVAVGHHYEIQIDDNKLFTSVDQQNSQIYSTTYTVNPGLPMLPPATIGTTYYWRVRGLNISNQPGPWSLTRTFIVDMVPPPVPTQKLPADKALLATLKPAFSWSVPLNSAVGFRLDVDDDPNRDGLCDFAAPVINNLSVTPATYAGSTLPQGSYCWRVRSVDAAGNISADSTARAFTIFIASTPADKALYYTVGVAASINVPFKWAAVAGTTSYSLTLFDDTCTTPKPGYPMNLALALNKPVAVTHGKYCWNIQAIGPETTTPTIFRTLTVSPPLPAAPVLVSPVAPSAKVVRIIGDNTPEFVWNATTSTSGASFTYDLQVDNSGCKFPSVEIEKTGLGVGYTALSTLDDGVYCWRVRTVNTYGVAGAWSVGKAFTLDTVLPAAPTLSLPAANAATHLQRPSFTWVAAVGSGSVGYRLDIDDDPELDGTCDFAPSMINDVAVTKPPYAIPAAASALKQGGYCWRVQALDTAGNPGPETDGRALRIFIGTAPADKALFSPVGTALTHNVAFKWAAVPDATSYLLSLFDATCTTLANSYPMTSVQFTKTLALARGTHCWKVQAVGVDATMPTTFFKVIVSPAGPLAPGLVSPLASTAAVPQVLGDNTPEFKWNVTTSTANASFTYEIQADNSGCKFPSPEISVPIVGLTHIPALPLADGVYCWRARSVNSYGAPGAWSVGRSFTVDTTKPNPPTLTLPLNAALLTTLRPTFGWTAALASGSTSYRLDVAADPDLDGNCDFNALPLAINNLTVAKSPFALVAPNAALPQGSYCWRVRAADAGGNIGIESGVRAFKIFIGTLPLDNATATSVGTALTANVKFTWVTVPGATSYTLKLYNATCITEQFSYPMGTLLTKTAPVPHGKYCWKVQAVGIDPAVPTTFRTLTVSPAPSVAPVLTTPIVNGVTGDTTPEFIWTGIVATAGTPFTYDLQVDNSGCKFPTPEINETGLGLTYTLSTALDDGIYCWKVRAVNTYGVAGAWSAPRSMTVDTSATGAPTLVAPLDNASASVPQPAFSWSRVAAATSYQVQIKTVDTACEAVDVPLITVPASALATVSFVPSSPLLNRTYYWCVRALDSVNNSSPWSVRRAVKIISSATAVSILNRFAGSSIKLSWGAINWVVPGGSYQVQVDNNANFLSAEYSSGNLGAATQSINIATVSPLTPGTWYWHVRACSAGGVCGLWSTSGTFTIETP